MVIFNLLKIFLFVRVGYSQTVFTPKYKTNNKYPFLLPFQSNDNYYVITSQNSLFVNKENGNIKEEGHIFKYSDKAIFCTDINKYSYIFDYNSLYSINQNKIIYSSEESKSLCSIRYIGCITLTQKFVIYDINSNTFSYIIKNNNENNYNCYTKELLISQKFSCKFMKINNLLYLICAEIYAIGKITITLLRYNDDNFNLIFKVDYDNLNNYNNLTLHDTTKASIKILCRQNKINDNIFLCQFFTIKDYNTIQKLSKEDMTFIIETNDFSEKDCFLF